MSTAATKLQGIQRQKEAIVARLEAELRSRLPDDWPLAVPTGPWELCGVEKLCRGARALKHQSQYRKRAKVLRTLITKDALKHQSHYLQRPKIMLYSRLKLP